MAARGSAGLLLCVALLLAMPALAATPAERDECAASVGKPEVASTACSRIIDDASESVAERIEAFKNRGRRAFNGRDFDRAIADYSEAFKLGPKDAWALVHRSEAYEGKEDHDAAIADCTEAIGLDPKYGWAWNDRTIALRGQKPSRRSSSLLTGSSGSIDCALRKSAIAWARRPSVSWERPRLS